MLMLHAGAEAIDYDGLRQLITPDATATHVPIPHFRLVDMLRHTLGFYGHEVTQEHHGVTPDGARYFGLLSLRSSYTGYEDTLGIRNSHDKAFPASCAFGSRVFVCDNLAFIGEHVIKRRHTVNLKRDLPGLIAQIVEPLTEQREAQHRTILRYQHTPIHEPEVNDAILKMYRRGVINVTRIADVVEAYDNPPHDWGEPSAWRLFNAATFALRGKVAENPSTTRDLHTIIDGVCEAA